MEATVKIIDVAILESVNRIFDLPEMLLNQIQGERERERGRKKEK